ncbi:hypothetical protein KEM56_000287 [Ascosphaera pollenicola]|nr:hypothetical protein KEM56_000287 [Ascosphaera pollenicola]
MLLTSDFLSPDDYRPHWSLSEEARNTERPFSRLQGSQLRNNPVTFVSGGTLAQENYAKLSTLSTEDTVGHAKVPSADKEPHLGDTQQPKPRSNDAGVIAEQRSKSPRDTTEVPRPPKTAHGKQVVSENVEAGINRVTLNGTSEESPLEPASSTRRHPTDDLASSDLSDDEVVFRGRGAPVSAMNSSKTTGAPSTPPKLHSVCSPPKASLPVSNELTEEGSAPAWAFKDQKGAASESEAESDILRDYIENLDREGMYKSEDDSSDAEVNVIEGEGDVGIDDFVDISTSDEMPNEVGAIFSIRARKSGTQYLVTGVGETIAEARWTSKERLLSCGAQPLLDKFLRDAALSSSDDDDDNDDDDNNNDSESDEEQDDEFLDIDDEAAKDRNPDDFMEQLSDEHIARALAKQEELYLDEDVMIFDGTEDIDFTYRKKDASRVQEGRTSKQKKNRFDSFPSAAAFVDVLDEDPYGAFDIMDFDAPSLREKNKGKRQPDFDLSDDDLAWQMEMSWENDRKKKAARKREREELRSQGLLGSKNGKPDMNAKYSTGMTIDDVKKELRLFIASSSSTLSLPPMAKKERKIVHEMAHMLNLKSLSRGNGKSRFPTLTKTSRTPHVRASEMDNFFSSSKVLRRLDRPRLDRSSRSAGGTKAATYEHGDVVGARAPEIGVGNKGRAMLEKMGWSSGTALGAMNNKGILEPVAHIVRKGKAGLG